MSKYTIRVKKSNFGEILCSKYPFSPSKNAKIMTETCCFYYLLKCQFHTYFLCQTPFHQFKLFNSTFHQSLGGGGGGGCLFFFLLFFSLFFFFFCVFLSFCILRTIFAKTQLLLSIITPNFLHMLLSTLSY